MENPEKKLKKLPKKDYDKRSQKVKDLKQRFLLIRKQLFKLKAKQDQLNTKELSTL